MYNPFNRLPNFVLINLDDCGYGDFSCYGATGYVTPYIDKMAAEGIRFTHFLAVQPVSGASRAGLMTGCYPNRIGMYGAPGPHDARGIHSDELTIGELLKQKGIGRQFSANGIWGMLTNFYLFKMGLMNIMDYLIQMICGLIILKKCIRICHYRGKYNYRL